MTLRVGINGFGRIGRTFLRAVLRSGADIDVVAANDISPPSHLAVLLEMDSVSGHLGVPVEQSADGLVVGGRPLRILSVAEPLGLPWGELGIDVVIEASRIFAPAAKARAHLDAGAAMVVVAMPSEGADGTFVVGVNDHELDPARHRIVSNGSCTTNCLAPMVRVLDDAFGLDHALMTTVHAYTSDQSLVDGPNSDIRQARAAAVNIVPTSTGAARALPLVLPAMAGRLHGGALRVPVVDGSITDLTALLGAPATAAEVNEAFRVAASASTPLARVLDYSERPLVSSDIVGSAASCTFDAPLTVAVGPMVKVFGWYDNEWAYSNRLVDLCLTIADRLGTRAAA